MNSEPTIIPSRANLTKISFEDIIADIELGGGGYCFFHVLKGVDRSAFMRELKKRPTLYLEIYMRKAIQLGDWCAIMGKIKLENFYIIYRRAYKGENGGNKRISSVYSEFMVEILAFGEPYHPVLNRGPVSSWLINAMGMNRRIPVSILAHAYHMKVITGDIKRSMWVNYEYETDCNKFYGL
jgi:hypothetical protein